MSLKFRWAALVRENRLRILVNQFPAKAKPKESTRSVETSTLSASSAAKDLVALYKFPCGVQLGTITSMLEADENRQPNLNGPWTFPIQIWKDIVRKM